jgi:hypothetical protein
MIKQKLLPVILGFSVLLQAAFFQVALPNMVLCIGDNGHVAFEWRPLSGHGQHNDAPLPGLFSLIPKEHSVFSEFNCTDINLHFHPSHAERVQKTTKDAFKIFSTIEVRNQKIMANMFSFETLQLSPPRLHIGTGQSTVLII